MSAHDDISPWDLYDERAPRAAETREFEQEQPAWRPASQLPNPHPRDGWVHRWVMVSVYGDEQPTHFSQMRREGWQECQAEEYPELALELKRNDSHYAQKGLVEIGGLVLCRLPVEGVALRNAHYEKRNKSVVKNSTNELLSHQNRQTNMGTFVEQNRTQVAFGSGAKNFS